MPPELRTGLLGACAAFLLAVPASANAPSFITFETGPVRPLALAPGGGHLFAVNTPDARLEIFRVGPGGIAHEGSVSVGLEPAAVAARTDDEVWVVNHLSDSVSIVDVRARRVVRTLLVGDEPRDIVFAAGRAFVTTAHRGQHRTHPSIAHVPGAGDPKLTTPGVPRADVWVFDAARPGPGPGGTPLRIVELFGDTPRALAVSPDGRTVYSAVFHSGNQTATVPEGAVCDGFEPWEPCQVREVAMPGGNPGPAESHDGTPAPEVGLIVRVADGHWKDELGRVWDAAVPFRLPDLDVFALDASSLEPKRSYPHVGTVLFNMVTNPRTGALYVSNTEARNEVRFEGAGEAGGSTVQGRLHEARITVIAEGGVRPRHLNKHIDYDARPAPAGMKEHSLATPVDMVVSRDGKTLYVAAFGSRKVGVLPTAALEDDSFDPRLLSARYIALGEDPDDLVTGGGPSGLALDEPRGRLYVLTRFDNAVAVVDLAARSVVQRVALSHAEPAWVVEGRPFLYDARFSSSNGEASCASCHVFGDLDSLAWDLGDPDAEVGFNPMPIRLGGLIEFVQRLPGSGGLFTIINGTGGLRDFHPMKGPMTTQTLRGMVNSGHMHWRGDRADGFFGLDDPNTNDAELSFKNFIVAFPGLLGSEKVLTDPELQRGMQAFTDFTLEITLPPNPVRALDNSLNSEQAAGREFYMGGPDPDFPHFSDGVPSQILSTLVGGEPTAFTCNDCHRLDPARGHFGTDGAASFEAEQQILKIPHLRNLYQKVGMFGHAAVPFFDVGDNGFQGDQVRGFGFLHDGSTDTMFRFLHATVFSRDAFRIEGPIGNLLGVDFDRVGFQDDEQRREMESFMFAFDTDLAPVVGQQVTLSADNAEAVGSRIDLLLERSQTPFVSKILGEGAAECDLVVKGSPEGQPRGWLHEGNGVFRSDDGGSTDAAELRRLARRAPLTWTCVPPGSGRRMAIDRDEDGRLDARDNCPAAANDAQTDRDADGVGDVCDRCPALADADQLDTDADGVGDVCDHRCPGLGPTTLERLVRSSGRPGNPVQIRGTGFGPRVQVWFGNERSPEVRVLGPGRLLATVPDATPGPRAVRVVNPEGCRSPETLPFTIQPRPGSSGKPHAPGPA